jgi:hypothetical protein
MYEVQLSLEAERAYNNASRSLAGKLSRCFERLEENPRVSIQVWGLTKREKSAVGIRETTVSKG